MGTKLADYLEGDGRPKNPESAARREAFGRAYTLAVDLIEASRDDALNSPPS